MNPKVDTFLSNLTQWQDELAQLREIVLDCGLTEELKWGVPCYTYKDANVIIIHGFKNYCAIMFFKGVLLSDTHKILFQQTKNVQETRQARFTSVKEIVKLEANLKAYIFEESKSVRCWSAIIYTLHIYILPLPTYIHGFKLRMNLY